MKTHDYMEERLSDNPNSLLTMSMKLTHTQQKFPLPIPSQSDEQHLNMAVSSGNCFMATLMHSVHLIKCYTHHYYKWSCAV